MEIDIKDFMVGSFIITPICEEAEIQSIDGDEVNVFTLDEGDHRDYSINSLEAIPLSHEWLTKLEFEDRSAMEERWTEYTHPWCDAKLTVYKDGSIMLKYGTDYKVGLLSCPVHTLQSLFWHLCRVELTIQ